MTNNIRRLVLCLSVLILGLGVQAQTTQFPYYGNFPNSVTPATGTYDLEVRLFDAQDNGNQVGSTLTFSGVPVKNGSFAVLLDFGATPFSGADRFIEISERRSDTSDAFVAPSPRQKILSVPYAIRSLTAGTADAALSLVTGSGQTIDVSNLVTTNDPRLSDARDPLPGSANYIQNRLTQQPTSNFNVSGNGTAGGTLSGNVVNSSTQFNLGGSRVLGVAGGTSLHVGINSGNVSTGNSNLFVGFGAGFKNTTGSFNSFIGALAGNENTTGGNNTFVGTTTGWKNTTGVLNSFFGATAGASNTTGFDNTFIGDAAGFSNTTGSDNTFVGLAAGTTNTTGFYNTFFGAWTGYFNTTGARNAFFGKGAGSNTSTGSENAFFGSDAGTANTTGNGNAFFGNFSGGSSTTGENNAFFGRLSGAFTTVGLDNAFFGAEAGKLNTTGNGNVSIGRIAGFHNTTGNNNTAVGAVAGFSNETGSFNTSIGANANVVGAVSFGTAIGAGAVVNTSNTVVLGRFNDKVSVPGIIAVSTLGSAGVQSLCRNALLEIATCSSSLRYKTNIISFRSGLDLIKRLRPITFDWKEGGMHDLGLGAEDVAAVEPLLATYNNEGKVEGVKYDRVGVVLVNAVNEQQTQIDQLKKENADQKLIIERQQLELNAIKRLLCSRNRRAALCR